VAPERFDFGNTAERLRDIGVSLLAIDEAHCISEWGHDFRPSYLRMRAVRERLGDPTTVALTATATPDVRKDIELQLALRDPERIVTGFDRKNLHYHVVPVKNDAEKDHALVETLERNPGQAIIYAATRKSVERVTGVLTRAKLPVVAYHAGLDDAHRHEVQDAFMNEQVRAIVATNAFGMGIDKPNVRLVVHHAMPGSLEAYYQEAGRAGRDGLDSEVYLLHAFPDRFTHEFFIKGAYPDRALVEQVYDRLRRDADQSGGVNYGPADLAAVLPGKISQREVESAVRVLSTAGAVRNEQESPSRVYLRLLATPDRIKREIGQDNVERELLRALWRAVGSAINTGAVVDLDGLPPGFGGGPGVLPVLEALQARQFVQWERTGGGTRLVNARASLATFDMEWPAIERRRNAEMSKLDAVQRYAYHTGCRRAFVLKYFGDPAARSTCEGCDNCLGLHKGIQRPAATAPAPRSRAKPRAERGAIAPVPDLALGESDAPLFAELRALRASIAREEQVPAYVVFSDRTLAELAVRRPRSLAMMGDVRGIGPAKLEKYGERFLAAIRGASDIEAA
jgi:ATP-dependent DNA helicase RecQ